MQILIALLFYMITNICIALMSLFWMYANFNDFVIQYDYRLFSVGLLIYVIIITLIMYTMNLFVRMQILIALLFYRNNDYAKHITFFMELLWIHANFICLSFCTITDACYYYNVSCLCRMQILIILLFYWVFNANTLPNDECKW